MGICKNEHDDDIDEDWEPGNPVLKGSSPREALAVPKSPPLHGDELRHSQRRALGLDNEDPDEDYDPDADDLEEIRG